ncbi:Serine/threonine-protein kinase fray2 [Balamuthia mandrillaris]
MQQHATGASGEATAEPSEKQAYPREALAYELIQPVGFGSQGVVWRALCKPLAVEVAIKIIDLVTCPTNLEEVRKEIQVMRLCDHKNVVEYHCSFVHGQHLWLVMELLAGGSCLDIMKYAYPNGLSETLIASILLQALNGIEYIHKTGRIHRDIKAGNLVISREGVVKLSDFGVAAWLVENGERKHNRQTFVGTPCWMAPEVLEQVQGYDYRADIWSFGITALELARGQAPFAKLSPMKVLMMILQSPPPKLEWEEKEKFSKHFKDLVESCLRKEPEKRPTATKLLEHKFFKKAKGPEFLAGQLLAKLPPLWERVKKTHPNKDSTHSRAKDGSLPATPHPQHQQQQTEGSEAEDDWDFSIPQDSTEDSGNKKATSATDASSSALGSGGSGEGKRGRFTIVASGVSAAEGVGGSDPLSIPSQSGSGGGDAAGQRKGRFMVVNKGTTNANSAAPRRDTKDGSGLTSPLIESTPYGPISSGPTDIGQLQQVSPLMMQLPLQQQVLLLCQQSQQQQKLLHAVLEQIQKTPASASSLLQRNTDECAIFSTTTTIAPPAAEEVLDELERLHQLVSALVMENRKLRQENERLKKHINSDS